jgi:hypothetical protein
VNDGGVFLAHEMFRRKRLLDDGRGSAVARDDETP